MLVEDDPDFAILVERRLRGRGVALDVVRSARDALARLAAGDRPSAVLTDLVFSGEAVTGELVADSARARHIPAMVCSDLDPRWGPAGCRRKVHLLERLSDAVAELVAGAA